MSQQRHSDGVAAANEYISGDSRGDHLQLAQRHRVIATGQFHGRKKLEPEFAHPGIVGQLALSFTASTTLPTEARIVCILPDHGWGFPSTGTGTINAAVRLPQGLPIPALRVLYTVATRTLELTLLSNEIPANAPVVILLSGISTPEVATPASEVTVTSYEKLVVRNTVPPSTRGGQVLDGPTVFTMPKIVPGELTGTKKWQPFSCCPGVISDVTLSFTVQGRAPRNGKILIELPSSDAWDMDETPRVLLRTATYHNESLAASWRRDQHTLEVDLGSCVLQNGTTVILTICAVKNPDRETMHSAATSSSSSATRVARITTLAANGGVICGPTKMDVAEISELREQDFVVAKLAFSEACGGGSGDTVLHVERLPELLRRTGVVLSDELHEALVVPKLKPACVAVAIDGEPTNATSPQENLTNNNEISCGAFLTLFAQVHAPAYKYGQELRLACGRGDLARIHELICRGCDVNAKDGSGWSALHYVADYGQLDALECIVETLATIKSGTGVHTSLDINTTDLSGWTPLVCAAANGHTAFVTKLLSLGADLMIATTDGRTALHWAASRGMEDCVLALLAAGANKDAVDRSGWTALHCAALHGSESCSHALVEQGASAAVKDKLQYLAAKYSNGVAVM